MKIKLANVSNSCAVNIQAYFGVCSFRAKPYLPALLSWLANKANYVLYISGPRIEHLRAKRRIRSPGRERERGDSGFGWRGGVARMGHSLLFYKLRLHRNTFGLLMSVSWMACGGGLLLDASCKAGNHHFRQNRALCKREVTTLCRSLMVA